MKKPIALIGFEADAELARVASCLRARGAQPIGVDLSRFPAASRVTVSEKALRVDGVDLLRCGAGLLRQVGYMWPMPARAPNKKQWGATYEHFARWISDERECTSLKYALVSILAEQMPVINPIAGFTYHQMKPLMHAVLAEAGVPVPEWIATNDAAELRRFARRQGRRGPAAVVKPLAGGAEVVAAPTSIGAGPLGRAPRLFQRLVRGDSVRAYVLGRRVIAACRIEHGACIDWRRDIRSLAPIRLDRACAALAARAARSLQMRFAGIDIELTSAGPRFLDVNPTPLFVGFEKYTGLDVAGPLADDLLALAADARP
ncbi:MAG: hypothetical protein JXR83_20205 [Deltaproteobacteria bacterium]|nr:hypothetical protein [Deltaproteobacteria bacterium]